MIFARQNVIFGIGPEGCPCHLGDLWAGTSYLLRLSERRRSRIVVSNFSFGGLFIGPMIGEIQGLLDPIGVLHFTDERPQSLVDLSESFKHNYVRTRTRWRPNSSRTICYQFDGRTEHDKKNLAEDEVQRFLDGVQHDAIDIGHFRPLAECIEIAARSRFFVGVPSGLGHVCASVGTPVHIIYNRKSLDELTSYAYRNKPFTYYRTVNDFLTKPL